MIDQVVDLIVTDKIVVNMDDVSYFLCEKKYLNSFFLQQILVVVHGVINMGMILDLVIHVPEMIEEEEEVEQEVVVVVVIIIDKDNVIVIKMMITVRIAELIDLVMQVDIVIHGKNIIKKLLFLLFD